ncbi:MAG: hypothetical protein KC519_13770 [Anaerolineae bacterium]|nr:hypothetical protein [Anaerolineae bacterium]
MEKPPRTLGIAIAIIASVCLFSCLPLLQVVMFVAVRGNLATELVPLETGGTAAFGGCVLNASDERLILQAGLALIFLIIAAVAWRGKPPIIRFVLVAAVLLLSAGNIVLLISTLATPQTLQTGIDSGETVTRSLATMQLLITVLIPLYVVWYMNRGPARAFFRGYYLKEPARTTPAKTTDEITT